MRIRILEHDYFIKSDESEEKVQRVAQFVNQRLLQIRQSAGDIAELKIALLGVFSVAGEYLQMLDASHDREEHIKERIGSLSVRIDDVLT